MRWLPSRLCVWILALGAVAIAGSQPVAVGKGRKAEKPLSPEAIFEKKLVGPATVEFVVDTVATVNIDSAPMPGLAHALVVRSKSTQAGQAFCAVVSRDAATRLLRLGIADPAEHLRGKLLRVTGSIERESLDMETNYRLRVNSLDQVEVIRRP